jgi:ubiquinone/menaquinone biosynthesis C-methylase UbiE
MNPSFEHNTANDEKWTHRALTFDEKRYGYFRLMQRLLVDSIKLTSNVSFLDLGSGIGWAVRYIASKLRGQGKFIGIDIAEGMNKKARANSKELQNVKFIKANSEDIPLSDNYIDIAICSNSFHHYLHPQKALEEVKRVLKLQGKIYLLDITSDDFLITAIDRRVRKKEKEHVKFYSTKEYSDMFEAAGLNHIGSHLLKIFYPLKVHIGEKTN